MLKVKQVKIEFFFFKKEWKLRPESKKTNKFLPTFPFEFFFSMFTLRAMFFFPMLDQSPGDNVAPKTINFKSIYFVLIFRNLILVDVTVIGVKFKFQMYS